MSIEKFAIVIILLFACIGGCGGGGGKYYQPQIVIDKIGIIKEEIDPQKINISNKMVLEGTNQLEENKKYISGFKYYYFRKFRFIEKEYKIGIPINNWVSIIDSNNRIIKKLETPRYTRNAAAIELVGKDNKKLLAVYIDQQATSHSSTLYILSEKLEILYQEHLLGAHWIAKEASSKGDNLIISTENMWRPKNDWLKVGGPWRYIVFR